MSATDEQPPPTPSTGPKIVDLVVSDLQAKAEAGAAKYGTHLRPNNGRNALIDAYQEALDLAMYLRQRIEERVPVEEEIAKVVAADRERCAQWVLASFGMVVSHPIKVTAWLPTVNALAIAERIRDGSPTWHDQQLNTPKGNP